MDEGLIPERPAVEREAIVEERKPRAGKASVPKVIPGFGIAIGLLVWIFTHVSQSTQQILAYAGVGFVIAVLVWGMWKFRVRAGRKSEPPNDQAGRL